MECSLKYVMVIFISIYLLLEFLLKNSKENFSVTMDDIISNPVKAGSIEDKENETNPDFYQFMNADNIFRKNIRDETKYFQQIRKPVQGDYKPYEVILPDKFQVPQVKYVDTRKIIGIGKIEDEFKEIDYKINARQVTMRDPNNDCQGEWSQWNEDNCYDPDKRCSLKYRRYNITKEKREQGLRCEYNGRHVKDGDLDYDYCYGGNNEERCNYQGNLCECNLDDMDDPDSHCDVELNNMCVCPDDIELDENGKCSPPPPTSEELKEICRNSISDIDMDRGRLDYIDDSTEATVTCDLGYISSLNKDSITCVNGEWGSTDGTCDRCAVNFYVKSNTCVKCLVGSHQPEGDDPSGGDTECRGPYNRISGGPPTDDDPSPPPSPPPSTPPSPPYVPPTPEESRHDETLKETIRRNYIILFIALMFITIIILSMFVY